MRALSQRLFCYRFFCIIGGLYGAGGIAAFAASKHIGGFYADFAPILLGNAPALLVLGLGKTEACLPRLAGLLIAAGAALFTLALLWLQYRGHHPFPYAAPIGGFMMILGWLLFIPCAFCHCACGKNGKNAPTLH